MPDKSTFEKRLRLLFETSSRTGASSVTVIAAELHRQVGGYPGKGDRMRVCCGVMRSHVRDGDRMLFHPPVGNGATLRILYRLPRGNPSKR